MNCDFCGNPLNQSQYVIDNNKLYKSCPECSQKSKEHIHYSCPEAFGTTKARASKNDPLGMQSQCAKCRSKKAGPHENAKKCSELEKANGFIINEIRTLPMSNSIFKSEDDIVEFLLDTMPNRNYVYYYKSAKIKNPIGVLMFFQYNGKLWGYAVCIDDVEEGYGDYSGFYRFSPNAFCVFEKPITTEEWKNIDVEFTSFGRAAKEIKPTFLPAIFHVITQKGKIDAEKNKNIFVYGEEISKELPEITEGAKKQVIVNAYERNAYARNICINHYRKINHGKIKCEICGFDFGETYGEQFANKIHVHHIVEISTIGKEYVVDPVSDLIPICPNCHMVAHSKKPAYTIKELKKFIKTK